MPPPAASAETTTDALEQYLNGIGRYRLLTPEEEVQLAQRMEAGLEAQTELSGLEDQPGQAKPGIKEMLELISKDGQDAKTQFFNANLRLVVSIARQYDRPTNRSEFLDLIQEGNLKLLRAIEKFDWKKGNKFSTYATHWIKEGITKHLDAGNQDMPVAEHVLRLIKPLKAAEDQLEAKQISSPSIEQLAEASGVPIELVQEALDINRLASRVDSLDIAVIEDGSTRGDLVEDKQVDVEAAVLDQLTNEQLKRKVAVLLGQLARTEQRIIVETHGLLGYEAKSQKDIAAELGHSTTYVRHLRNSAEEQLRRTSAPEDFPEIFGQT